MKYCSIVGVTAVLVVTTIGCNGQSSKSVSGEQRTWFKTAPAADSETFQRVLNLKKKKDYDRAIETALSETDGHSPDDFLLQTASGLCFERAQLDSANKEHWIALAVEYSERAFRRNPQDLLNIYNVGESYLSAGMNLSPENGCSYYSKSLKVFEKLKDNPLLKKDTATIDGVLVSAEPYRRSLDEKIAQVKSLLQGCKLD